MAVALLATVFTVVPVISSPAGACLPPLGNFIKAEALQASTPETITDSDSPLVGNIESMFRDGFSTGKVLGVWRDRTVIESESLRPGVISNGRVIVPTAIWGDLTLSLEPQVYGLGLSICENNMPGLGETRWHVQTEELSLLLFFADHEQAMVEEELARLFGEPLVVARDAAAEEAAFDNHVAEMAHRYRDTEVGEIHRWPIISRSTIDMLNSLLRMFGFGLSYAYSDF